MTGRMRLDSGLTVDVTHSGGLAVVQLPGYGTTTPQIAAKVEADGRAVALVLEPLARWNRSYGGWARDDEYRFQDAVQQLAQHFGGSSVLRDNPL